MCVHAHPLNTHQRMSRNIEDTQLSFDARMHTLFALLHRVYV